MGSTNWARKELSDSQRMSSVPRPEAKIWNFRHFEDIKSEVARTTLMTKFKLGLTATQWACQNTRPTWTGSETGSKTELKLHKSQFHSRAQNFFQLQTQNALRQALPIKDLLVLKSWELSCPTKKRSRSEESKLRNWNYAIRKRSKSEMKLM